MLIFEVVDSVRQVSMSSLPIIAFTIWVNWVCCILAFRGCTRHFIFSWLGVGWALLASSIFGDEISIFSTGWLDTELEILRYNSESFTWCANSFFGNIFIFTAIWRLTWAFAIRQNGVVFTFLAASWRCDFLSFSANWINTFSLGIIWWLEWVAVFTSSNEWNDLSSGTAWLLAGQSVWRNFGIGFTLGTASIRFDVFVEFTLWHFTFSLITWNNTELITLLARAVWHDLFIVSTCGCFTLSCTNCKSRSHGIEV